MVFVDPVTESATATADSAVSTEFFVSSDEASESCSPDLLMDWKKRFAL